MAHRGGDKAKAGFYWHAAGWEIVTLSGKGGTLPGTEAERYRRLPTLVMLLLAPVMGGLFVVFLPFIGFAMLIGHLGALVARRLRRAMARIVASINRPRHA
jgi:hypothetical protein